MSKTRAIQFAIAYSLLVIIYKVAVILSGNALNKFNFNFSHILSVLAIIPFIFLTVSFTRRDNGGFIGGKDALKTGLLMSVISALILSVYNYIEFEWVWRELSVEYYHSPAFRLFLEKQKQIKPENYDATITSAIAELSPFKATTGKLAALLFISLGASFMSAVFLKKHRPAFSDN